VSLTNEDGLKSFPSVLDEAKGIIRNLRKRFSPEYHILPPEVSLPSPPLTAERLEKARAELEMLIENLRNSDRELEAAHADYEGSKQQMEVARERVAMLEEQAERHGATLSASFTVKMEKARVALQCLLNGGIEARIAMFHVKIHECVLRINEQITSAKTNLHALEIEQRLALAPLDGAVDGRKDKPDKEKPKVKLAWRRGCLTAEPVEAMDHELSRHTEPATPSDSFLRFETPPVDWSFEQYLLSRKHDPVVQRMLARKSTGQELGDGQVVHGPQSSEELPPGKETNSNEP